MFNANKRELSNLDREIDRLHIRMREILPTSDEYSILLVQLTQLYGFQERTAPKRISRDTLAVVCGNLAGIVMILGHEKANVISSKALSFVLKAK